MDEEIGKVENIQNYHKFYEETQMEWRIVDFFRIIENKEFHNSPCFSAGDASSLYFSFYPKVNDNVMGIYLITKKSLEYAIEYNFSIKKSDGGIKNCFMKVSGMLQPKQQKSNLPGILGEFSELQSSKSVLVPNNVLTIMCTLRREITPPIHPTALGLNTNALKLIRLDKLSENFKNLFGESETCDTTLKVKEKEYKVHRLVLMARSPVFAAAFKHDTSEKQTGVITIPDCDPDSFQEFLQYLYTGRLEEISYIGALNLYVTSDKYDVPELKEFCVKYLKQCLTVENVCEVAVLAEKYDDTELLSSAQSFFNKNACEILDTSEWENLLVNHHRLVKTLLTDMLKVRLKY